MNCLVLLIAALLGASAAPGRPPPPGVPRDCGRSCDMFCLHGRVLAPHGCPVCLCPPAPACRIPCDELCTLVRVLHISPERCPTCHCK